MEGSDGEDSVWSGTGEEAQRGEGSRCRLCLPGLEVPCPSPSRSTAPPLTGEYEQPENPASPRCSGQRSSTPPAFVVMVQGHPDISSMCGCEWVRAVALTGLSFTRRPGCES